MDCRKLHARNTIVSVIQRGIMGMLERLQIRAATGSQETGRGRCAMSTNLDSGETFRGLFNFFLIILLCVTLREGYTRETFLSSGKAVPW